MFSTVPPSDAAVAIGREPEADKASVNELLPSMDTSPVTPGAPIDPPELQLQAVSTLAPDELMPGLMDAIDRASGWVLHRQMTSPSTMEIRMETQGRALMGVYAALLEQGLELSRHSHQMLTERCTCIHMQREARSSIVMLLLNLILPADLPMIGKWWAVSMA